MRLMYLPAVQEDIPVLCSLSRQLIDTYEDVASIPYEKVIAWVEKKIESAIGEYIRILCDGMVAGYFYLCKGEDGRLELDDFYVLEPFRGKGIGTEVLHEILANADEEVMLYVFERNTGAIRLYERMGFVTEKAVGTTRRIMVKRKESNE